ncbi:MAG: glycosidase [Planctomycetes bacterium]|nr:glycosidase [Planctomycetota bacterium]
MDIAQRFDENPIITPAGVRPSRSDLRVIGVMNPGAFVYKGRTALLLRVAQQPIQAEGFLRTAISDPSAPAGVRMLEFHLNDRDLIASDPRIFSYRGEKYLTSLSHLRLAWSNDGVRFDVDDLPAIIGEGPMEEFGVEDCRVARLDETFCLTYTAVSRFGAGVALMTTQDWKSFTRLGMILPPHNKDAALFERKIAGRYALLHRPMGVEVGGPYIWLSTSDDLQNWGRHQCVARTRPGMWDEERIGAGAAPILTDKGWLLIYHGADFDHRYCLGAMLLDIENPARVIARSRQPIMEPIMEYERNGFFANVVFSNGHVVNGDQITIYYGASDSLVCGARFSMAQVLSSLVEQKEHS